MATRGSSAWSLSAARLAAVSWEDKGTPVRDARGGLARWVDRGVARRRWHRLLPACFSSVGRSRPISQGCLYPGVTTPGLRTPARVTMGSVNHSELAALLRSRRARIRLSERRPVHGAAAPGARTAARGGGQADGPVRRLLHGVGTWNGDAASSPRPRCWPLWPERRFRPCCPPCGSVAGEPFCSPQEVPPSPPAPRVPVPPSPTPRRWRTPVCCTKSSAPKAYVWHTPRSSAHWAPGYSMSPRQWPNSCGDSTPRDATSKPSARVEPVAHWTAARRYRGSQPVPPTADSSRSRVSSKSSGTGLKLVCRMRSVPASVLKPRVCSPSNPKRTEGPHKLLRVNEP